MDPIVVYKTGLVIVILFALLWSFVLDRNKPSVKKEFIAKLFARALFLAFIFTVVVGFVYWVIGTFQNIPKG